MESFLIILIALIFSAFFSGMEIAFISSNRLRVELDKKQGAFGSKISSLFVRNPGQFISTMLVGNNIALVTFGLIFSRLVSSFFQEVTGSDAATIILQTVLSTLIVLFVAEFFPKNLFIITPNFFLRIFSIPSVFFYYIFYPVARFTLWISNLLIRLFAGKGKFRDENEDVVFSRAELTHFVNMIGGPDEENGSETSDIKIFRNALEFPNVKLRECMVPRTEIVALDISAPVAELKQKFIDTGYSKIPIFEDSIEIGRAHV